MCSLNVKKYIYINFLRSHIWRWATALSGRRLFLSALFLSYAAEFSAKLAGLPAWCPQPRSRYGPPGRRRGRWCSVRRRPCTARQASPRGSALCPAPGFTQGSVADPGDILVRIRIQGSVRLPNGSGSDYISGSCYFLQWPSRWQLKIVFSSKFFCLSHKEVTRQ